jgi:hypothetical protein
MQKVTAQSSQNGVCLDLLDSTFIFHMASIDWLESAYGVACGTKLNLSESE